MKRVENKINRLLQIEALLLDHPEGLSQAELARRLGVNRSTISRNMADMHAPVYEGDDGRYFIDRRNYFVHVRFNLHESLSIHLAARLLAQSMDRQNPNAAAALRKLGLALERLAPLISQQLSRSADSIDQDAQWQDAIYLHALETLTEGWAERRCVKVWFRNADDEPVREFEFSPYYIEPAAVGRSTYAIGLRTPPGEIRTFKIERIQRVEILRDKYNIPEDFDPFEILKDAWCIWFTGNESKEVVLKFSQRVAKRVGETRWHKSEQVTPLEDGSLLWRALIAEPIEMLPWIRGWGADCEVVGPESLRKSLKEEIQAAARLYGLKISADEGGLG